MLRVAGLPVEAVRPLRCPAARAWAERGAGRDRPAGRRRRRAERPARGAGQAARRDRPAPAAGAAPAGLQQPRCRATRTARWRSRPACPTRRAPPCGDWLTDRRRLDGRVAAGADIVAAELDRTRAELRALVAAEQRLRIGLLLASPTLDGQLDAYAAGSGRRTSGPGGSSARCCPTCTAPPSRPARSARSPAVGGRPLRRRGRRRRSGSVRTLDRATRGSTWSC